MRRDVKSMVARYVWESVGKGVEKWVLKKDLKKGVKRCVTSTIWFWRGEGIWT